MEILLCMPLWGFIFGAVFYCGCAKTKIKKMKFDKRTYLLAISLILNALMLCPTAYRGQTLSCTQPVKLGKDEARRFVVGSDSLGYFVASENAKNQMVEIAYYAFETRALEHTITIDLPEGQRDQRFEQLLFLQSGFIIFTGGFSKESEQYQIMASMLDSKGARVGPATLVHYTKEQTSNHALKFHAVHSPDGSKILMYFDPKFEQKRDTPLGLKVYQPDLELLWEKDLELPYRSDILEVHHYAIDNAADVYLMSGRNPAKDEEGIKTVQIGKHAVFYYNHTTNKLKEYNVGLKDKQVVSAIFQVHENGDLLIGGYYSNDAEFAAAGTFLFTIGSGGGAVKAASMMPFHRDFLLKFLREKQVENNPSLKDYYLDHMFIAPNGEILLVGEQYFVTETVSADPMTGVQRQEYRYHFDNAIATLLQPDGRQIWSTKISKAQYVLSNPEYCSYVVFQTRAGWQFYFNDSMDNEGKLSVLADGEATAWSGGAKFHITRVDLTFDGLQKRTTVMRSDDNDLYLQPFWSGDANSKRPLLVRHKGREVSFCAE
jgi:hypothetical protein